MSSVDTAVILAAGSGIRLKPLSDTIPKGCIKFGPRTIIEESMDILAHQGIRSVVLVTGHLAHCFDPLSFPSTIQLTKVHNPQYRGSGSLSSLMCAQPFLHSPFLLLDSDLLYEERAISELLSFPRSDALIVSGPTHGGDEVWVGEQEGNLVDLSKDKSQLQGHVQGEFFGISRLSLKLLSTITESFGRDLSGSAEYEQAFVLAADKHPIGCCHIPDLIWCEIDNEPQYYRANTTIYPLLRAGVRPQGTWLGPANLSPIGDKFAPVALRHGHKEPFH